MWRIRSRAVRDFLFSGIWSLYKNWKRKRVGTWEQLRARFRVWVLMCRQSRMGWPSLTVIYCLPHHFPTSSDPCQVLSGPHVTLKLLFRALCQSQTPFQGPTRPSARQRDVLPSLPKVKPKRARKTVFATPEARHCGIWWWADSTYPIVFL